MLGLRNGRNLRGNDIKVIRVGRRQSGGWEVKSVARRKRAQGFRMHRKAGNMLLCVARAHGQGEGNTEARGALAGVSTSGRGVI